MRLAFRSQGLHGSRDGQPNGIQLVLLLMTSYITSAVPLMYAICGTQDGVESESEAVTLGEDPYSDYSISADNHIIMGYRPMDYSRTPQGNGAPQQMQEQYASFHGAPLEDMVGSSSDLTDILPASVFEGGGADDPSDPYYF